MLCFKKSNLSHHYFNLLKYKIINLSIDSNQQKVL